MIKRYYKFALVIVLMMVLVGCATIVHGGRQKIPVKSDPSGATVSVNRIKVQTPGVINLSRLEPMATLRFEKEGYEPVEITLIRTTDGWLWGNVLFGGIIGIAIDFATGAAYQLSPNQVNVTLKSLGYEEEKKAQTVSEQFEKEKAVEEPKVLEEPKVIEEPKAVEESSSDRVVVIDSLSRPSSYSEYYRHVYRTISAKVIMPEGAPGGAVNVGVTILSDGSLENVEILGNSSEETALREAVIKAVKDSAPFPPFPDDIKEGRKAFTVMIEFRQNRQN